MAKSSSWISSIGGTVDGSFFRCAPWIDQTLPPGYTDQAKTLEAFYFFGFPLRDLFTGKVVICTPTFTFLCISLAYYLLVPWDLEGAKTMNMLWLRNRFLFNFAFLFAFYGFWHGATYGAGWAKRPFKAGRRYRASKVAHNVFYFSLGVIQWTVWEGAFAYCYATERLPFVSDATLLRDYRTAASVVFQVWMGFLWHELHFYFMHRMSHTKCLYRYIHAVHHRNTDIEPFAGLCMHPIEHLYYFASASICVYLHTSPFVFHYFMMLNVLAPAASHSGWEDHFQGDQMHYMHHRFFECNYGTSTLLFDRMFGTYRESLQKKSKTYKGEHVETKSNKVKLDVNAASIADAKANIFGLPKWDEAVYNLVTCVGLPCAIYLSTIHQLNASQVAALVAFGPPACSFVLHSVLSKRLFEFPRRSLLYPFHKESIFGGLGMHLLVGAVTSVVPVYHMLETAFSQPGASVYFRMRGT